MPLPAPKNPGDLVESQDWNKVMDEIVRLENAKINKAGDPITGNVGIGIEPPRGKLDVNGEIVATNRMTLAQDTSDKTRTWHLDNYSGRFRIFDQPAIKTPGIERLTITVDGSGTTSRPGVCLQVADHMVVGSFPLSGLQLGQGCIEVAGPVAELGLVKRELTSWPASPAPGDRFVWYNSQGIARLWDQPGGDLLTVDSNGDLKIKGNAIKQISGGWTLLSDIRLKKNVESLKGALGKLLRLRGVNYEWKEPEKHGNLTGPQMGLVAQEVEEVFPDWIGTDPDGYKNLTVRGFEALAVEALRELKDENASLKAKNRELEARLEALEKRLNLEHA